MFGLERPRERGTAPPRAAPAIGMGGFVPQGAQGARQPGQQDGRLDSHGERTVGLDPDTQALGAIRADDTVYPGARAQQARGNLGRGAARRPEQQDMEREKRALPCTAEDGTHLDLVCWS